MNERTDENHIRQERIDHLPERLMDRFVCELGPGDHGHTDCWLASVAAIEIRRMRLVLGDLTEAKRTAVSRMSRARYKARRRIILIRELRDQNRRLIAELLAYRAEESQ